MVDEGQSVGGGKRQIDQWRLPFVKEDSRGALHDQSLDGALKKAGHQERDACGRQPEEKSVAALFETQAAGKDEARCGGEKQT